MDGCTGEFSRSQLPVTENRGRWCITASSHGHLLCTPCNEKLGVISASGWTPVATMARSRMSFAVCLLNVLRGCLVEGRVFL
uniref:Uncharacterized protein n=1 Tax=Setaria viridis TaxID=4556 RepID=A0A4V6DAD7_SETVI|nr:hypothetical protein SEVIR_3G384200v2 [Setaria viridis]